MNDRWKKDYYRMTGEKYKNGIKSFATMRFSHQIKYMKLWRKVSNVFVILLMPVNIYFWGERNHGHV